MNYNNCNCSECVSQMRNSSNFNTYSEENVYKDIYADERKIVIGGGFQPPYSPTYPNYGGGWYPPYYQRPPYYNPFRPFRPFRPWYNKWHFNPWYGGGFFGGNFGSPAGGPGFSITSAPLE